MDNLIIDADFLIGYILESDPHHEKVAELMEEFKYVNFQCLNLVQYEVANVLSRLKPQTEAINLFDLIQWDSMDIIWMDEKLTQQALAIYRTQTKKNISITDCANLVLAQKYAIKIASFDNFYPAEFRIK